MLYLVQSVLYNPNMDNTGGIEDDLRYVNTRAKNITGSSLFSDRELNNLAVEAAGMFRYLIPGRIFTLFETTDDSGYRFIIQATRAPQGQGEYSGLVNVEYVFGKGLEEWEEDDPSSQPITVQ